ncbi:POP1 [Candida theae]|uniref:POP1 n=1 Tax=Candida theae TaxID=1198502 RepID=A0AAD5B9L1_9ASCO|nr:POP1 [Candida theae]KAI5948870.1 POP1 [Candida theae]
MSNNQRTPGKSQLNKKKTRLYNSRNIKAQITDLSYDKSDTKLNVPEFLESRKYEINALESSQLKSKQALNSRCFQDLPRSMRRRAASHHISRIPKRLRAKALREMKGANGPPRKVAKGRRLYKLLHTQKLLKVASKLKKERHTPDDILKKLNVRALHKEVSKELDKKWRPSERRLNNDVGSFDHSTENSIAKPPPRSIKYGSRQQKFSWIPTHIWHAKRFKMSKQFDFQVPYTPTQKCFKLMNRQNRHKAVCFDTSYRGCLILTMKPNTNITYYLHELLGIGPVPIPLAILNGKKSCTGLIHDKSAPIGYGTIYVAPESNQIFLQVLTDNYEKFVGTFSEYGHSQVTDVFDCRYSIGSIDLSGPSSLEYLSKVLHLRNASDKLKSVWASLSSHSDSSLIPIGTTLTLECYDPRLWNKPTKFPTKSEQDIYDTVIQLNNESFVEPSTIKSLFSAEGRYKSYENQLSIKDLGKIKSHGTPFEKVSHSKIPLLLTKTALQRWSLLCPWFWTLPIWTQLVKIPEIKAGGLRQLHQFNFESHEFTYPYDYPWADEGQKYNCIVGELSRETDAKKPKKVMSLQKAENRFSTVYDAYTCDWHTLRCAMYAKQSPGLGLIEDTARSSVHSELPGDSFTVKLAQLVSANRDQNKYKSVVLFQRGLTSKSIIMENVTDSQGVFKVNLPVTKIVLKVLREGVIENNARIYDKNVCKDIHVVGFVTTGGLNLNEGKFTGIGAVFVTPYMEKNPNASVYVRNPGKESMYACKYQLIDP